MKIKSILSKQTTLFLILTISFATLFLPLTSTQAFYIVDSSAAVNVLGQPDLTSNSTAQTATGLSSQAGIAFDPTNNRLFVADRGNNRVVVYDTSSISDGEAAINVLGQSDFTSTGSASASSTQISTPNDLILNSDGTKLYVSDEGYHRVLVFDVTAITDGEAAVNVLGQNDFTSSDPNRGGSAGQGNMSKPMGLGYDEDNDHLYVADQLNNRIQIFDVTSITDGESSISVLGQVGFTQTLATTTAAGMGGNPGSISVDETNDRAFVFDRGNQRVLVYDVASTTNGEAAINVIGQPDFTTSGASLTQTGINGSGYVNYDSVNDYIYVADTSGNRVLAYDVASITNGEAAVNILGQADYTSQVLNWEGVLVSDGKGGWLQGPGSKGFSTVYDVDYDSTNERLYVSDTGNSRVVIFDFSGTAPSSGGSGWSFIHPPLCAASFSPNTITRGESTTLSWNISWPTDKQNTYYTKVPKEGLFSHSVSSININPEHSTIYSLAIFNLWGANFCEAEIMVLDESGQELTSINGGYLAAGASNNPYIKVVINFFKKIFTR